RAHGRRPDWVSHSAPAAAALEARLWTIARELAQRTKGAQPRQPQKVPRSGWDGWWEFAQISKKLDFPGSSRLICTAIWAMAGVVGSGPNGKNTRVGRAARATARRNSTPAAPRCRWPQCRRRPRIRRA